MIIIISFEVNETVKRYDLINTNKKDDDFTPDQTK